MSIMDRLAKLDSSMQRGLDNSMAALFGGKVVPAEIGTGKAGDTGQPYPHGPR